MRPREANRARRARLIERAASERDELGAIVAPWRKPLAAVDQGLAIVGALKRSAPVLAAGIGAGLAALAFVRPASIGGWLRNGQALWQALSSRDHGAALPSGSKVEP
jgi:YqjK-like protein